MLGLFIPIVFLVFPLSANALISEGGRGMLFGQNHAFTITAISGWVLDNESGLAQGLHMVFYPKGESWVDSPVIIYGRVIATSEVNDVPAHVENTVDDFRMHGNPNYTAKKQKSITLTNGNPAEFYYFEGDQWGNYEAAVYVKEPETINYLVFNARTKAHFDQYVEDFIMIAKSYDNVYGSTIALSPQQLAKLKKRSDSELKLPGRKQYESRAVAATGQLMANYMSDCSTYLANEETPSFSYIATIDSKGSTVASSIYPKNAWSVCFSGLMSMTRYPPHTFDSFLLNIEMKIK